MASEYVVIYESNLGRPTYIDITAEDSLDAYLQVSCLEDFIRVIELY